MNGECVRARDALWAFFADAIANYTMIYGEGGGRGFLINYWKNGTGYGGKSSFDRRARIVPFPFSFAEVFALFNVSLSFAAHTSGTQPTSLYARVLFIRSSYRLSHQLTRDALHFNCTF